MAGSMRATTRRSVEFTARALENAERGRELSRGNSRGPLYCLRERRGGRAQKKERKKKKAVVEFAYNSTYLSVPAFFMMVSLPDDAAFTICCSTELFILALS